MKKTCPKCKGKSVKLYRNKTIDGKRTWVPIMWYCTQCCFIYQIQSDTLLYKSGELIEPKTFASHCKNCDKKLTRLYQHINPKYGKQRWHSIGWYCDRCRYAWIESTKKSVKDEKSL